jgi:hypothetical protein
MVLLDNVQNQLVQLIYTNIKLSLCLIVWSIKSLFSDENFNEFYLPKILGYYYYDISNILSMNCEFGALYTVC